MMDYPHHLLIRAPGAAPPVPATPEEGHGVPSEGDVIYDGRADVQDAGENVVYGTDSPTQTSEATAFLADESNIAAIRSGMTVTITWNPDGAGDDTDDAVIDSVTRLDGTIKLRFV